MKYRHVYQNNIPKCTENFQYLQYIPRNMHTVFAVLCFVVVIHWLIFPYPSGLLHWHCGNLTIAPVPAKQPWWIWINTSCEFIMNDCITTTKQSTTKPCAYFLGYTVCLKEIGSCALRWSGQHSILVFIALNKISCHNEPCYTERKPIPVKAPPSHLYNRNTLTGKTTFYIDSASRLPTL